MHEAGESGEGLDGDLLVLCPLLCCHHGLLALGVLQQVGERRVDYRNRPVAEYAPADVCNNDEQVMTGFAALDDCLQTWAR